MNKKLTRVKRRLEKTKKDLEAKTPSGALVFEIETKKEKQKIVLLGMVGTQKLKDKILGVLERSKGLGAIEERIKILTDPKHHLEIGWGKANSLVDLYRLPLASLEKRSRRDTQVLPGESFRVLVKLRSWLLVQAEDLACGWLRESKEVNWYPKQKTSSKKLAAKWQKVKRLKPGKMITLSVSPHQFSQAMEKVYHPLLGIPYIFGGRSNQIGFDCSSLVQKIVLDLTGYLLPKNSRDQAQCGKVITKDKFDKDKLKVGDLVFVRMDQKIPHNGIVVPGGILHSEGIKHEKIIIDKFEEIEDKKNFAFQWVRDFSKVVRIFAFRRLS